MIRSLRKGHERIYFQHPHVGNDIGADTYECEIADGKAIFRFTLRPKGSNETMDRDYLREHEVQSIATHDNAVIDGLQSYLMHHRSEFSSWEVQVKSQGLTLKYPVKPWLDVVGDSSTLTFNVQRES